LREVIDLVVLLDTPLEVSYIRKISRKTSFLPWEDDPKLFLHNLRENMDWYLRVGRDFYLAVNEEVRRDCDLVVDGLLPTSEIAARVAALIQHRQSCS
jgi:uridine kinase